MRWSSSASRRPRPTHPARSLAVMLSTYTVAACLLLPVLVPSAGGSPIDIVPPRPRNMDASTMQASLPPAASTSTDTATTTAAPLPSANPSSSATATGVFNINNTITVTLSATSTATGVVPTATATANTTSNSTTPSAPSWPPNLFTNFTGGRSKIDFLNPLLDGGFMTTILPMPDGQPNLPYGEPINAIISGRSSPSVVNVEGFLRWATSVQSGVSCLGQTNGSAQLANVGDGRGNITQGNDGSGDNGVLRYNYGDPYIGTCRESIIGGNHFRWFPQPSTGAYFIAASVELSAALGHMIALDGYNDGRDQLVEAAIAPNGTEWAGYRFNTTVTWIEAGLLLNATSEGINHPSVALPNQPSQDGRVAVLTITQLASPDTSGARSLTWSRGLMSLGGLLALAMLGQALVVGL